MDGLESRFVPQQEAVTAILVRASGGDHEAAGELLPMVYAELRRLASRYLENERVGHTLQPTALVHEAYLRMVGGDRDWTGRDHFLAACAVAMRRILVDHARRRQAAKRGKNPVRVDVDPNRLQSDQSQMRVLELDELLVRLAELNPRCAKVVELRFFSGMSNEEISRVLGVAASTVSEAWTVARAWLAGQIADRGGEQ